MCQAFLMSQELPNISEAEWKVVEVLWESSPKTSFEIVEKLQAENDWSPKTIKTLLHRLVKKEVIGFENLRREYSYFPLIEKKEYVANESEGFLQRMFNGATAPMIAHFVKNKKMSREELVELRRLLDEISEEEK